MKNTGSVILSNYYLLTNTEFKFSSTLIGFELFAISAGNIYFTILEFIECGSKILCGDYFKTSSTFTRTVLYSWSYNVDNGYNKILLTFPVKVPKGAMVYLDMFSNSGRISVDNNSESYFTDYYANSTSISRIDTNRNIRFHFNCLIEQSYYDYNFNSLFSFDRNGYQNLIFRFSNDKSMSSLSVTKQVFIFNSI